MMAWQVSSIMLGSACQSKELSGSSPPSTSGIRMHERVALKATSGMDFKSIETSKLLPGWIFQVFVPISAGIVITVLAPQKAMQTTTAENPNIAGRRPYELILLPQLVPMEEAPCEDTLFREAVKQSKTRQRAGTMVLPCLV